MDEPRYRDAERRLWDLAGATPVEHRLKLKRNDVTVRVQEIGEGPPVIFLHGGNTSGSSWTTLAARLKDFRCLVLDRPGTGLSEALRRPLDLERLPAFAQSLVVDVLDALGLESAHVVASSFGGYVALQTAAAHHGRVRRMVLFSWPVGAMTTPLPAYMRVSFLPVLGSLLAALPPSERGIRMMFRTIGHGRSLEEGRITREDLDCYLALLRDTDTARNELAMGRALFSRTGALHDGIRLADAVLDSIRAPTYFLWGENDPFGGAETARGLVDRIAGAELELMVGGGHAPWLDDLDRAALTVRRFLGRDDGPR